MDRNYDANNGFNSLKLIKLGDLVQCLVEEAYEKLQLGLQWSTQQNGKGDVDEEKGQTVLQALHEAKQKLMRLHILLQWSHKAKAAVQCKRVLDSCQQDGDAMVATADQLAYLHSELLHTRAPTFEVPSSFRILRDGDIQLLPNRIWREVGLDRDRIFCRDGTTGWEERKRKASLAKMMFLLRSKVMEDISGYEQRVDVEFHDNDATVCLRSKELLFEIVLCLAPAPCPDVVVHKWCGDDVQVGQQSNNKATRSWRWRVLSVKGLPALYNLNIISPGTLDLVRQSLEDRMWVASDVQVLQDLGLKEQSRMSFQQNTEEKDDTPSWATSPMKAAISLMTRVSSHILVGVVLADSARALESGSWKGLIKVGKPLNSNGIRIDMWSNVPTISADMLRKSKSPALLDEGWSGEEDHLGAALEVTLVSSEVIPSVFPAGTDGSSSVSIAELCGLEGDGAANLNKVLLRIAKDLSTRVLECIAGILRRLVAADEAIADYFVISFIGGHDMEPPRLDLISYNEDIMSLGMHLKSGDPIFIPGFSTLEDGPVAHHAQELIQSASVQLKRSMEGLQDLSKAVGQSMSSYYCSLVARKALQLWSELVSFISVRHILYQKPLDSLIECSNIPGVLVESNKYVFCYKITSPANSMYPASQTMARNAKMCLAGYFVLYSALGSIRFQSSKLCIYEMDSISSSITRERIVYDNIPHWKDIVSEDIEDDISGKKRSREDSIVTCPKIRRQLSQKSKVYFEHINEWVENKFTREFMLFQFEALKLQHSSTESDLVFNVSLPRPLLKAMQSLVPGSNSVEAHITASKDFSFSMTLLNSPLSSWPGGIFDHEQQSNVRYLPRLSHGNGECIASDTRFEIHYKSSKGNSQGVWNGILDVYHILECQAFTKRLVDTTLTISDALSMSIECINLDQVDLKISGKGWKESFDCFVGISWTNGTLTRDWPHGPASLLCQPIVHVSKDIPTEVQKHLNSMLQNLVAIAEDVTRVANFMHCLSQYVYIGHFLEDCLGTKKTNSIATVDQGPLQFSDATSCSILCNVTFYKVNSLKCSFRIYPSGFTDFSCSSSDGRDQWLNELWNMWTMEAGWNIDRQDGHICAPKGDLESLSHVLSELLYAAAGQR